LEHDKNVYILGAGFSKEIGLPLQDDFLLAAREVFFKNPTIYAHFENVFRYQDELTKMKKFLNYPLLNLEHLFNLVEMDIFYSNLDAPRTVKNDFQKMICDVLIEKTPNPFFHDPDGRLNLQQDIFKNYLSFASILIKDYRDHLSLHADTIISFNYDIIVEAAACIYNWKRYRNNSSGKTGSIKFNTIFGKDNILQNPISESFKTNRTNAWFPEDKLFSESEDAVKLIKLHGSINWKTVDNDIQETFIVPPTWNKSDIRIRRLWEKAYQELVDAQRIIIIGYSFPETDIYVKSLLALALNKNRQLQNIYFVNPDETVARKTCLSLLDKYFEKYCAYKPWPFSHFVNSEEGKRFIKENLNRQVTA